MSIINNSAIQIDLIVINLSIAIVIFSVKK